MRNSIDSTEFCDSVERISDRWYSQRSSILKKLVVDNSNFRSTDFFFNLKRIGLIDFIRLSILSWYMDEEVRTVLQSDLHVKLKDFGNEDRTLCEQFLFSKPEMLIFLMETRLWHSRDFFGNILQMDKRFDLFIKLAPFSKKIKEIQRKRGYHDHGSRVEDHKWKPKSDYSLTAKQNDIELNRIIQRDTSDLIRGFLN